MVVFVNCFAVPAGSEDEFLGLWEEVNVYMTGKPGYVDHALHRAVNDGASYQFVNIAHWESEDAWRQAHDGGFRSLVSAPAWREFRSAPTLCDAVPIHQGSAAEWAPSR